MNSKFWNILLFAMTGVMLMRFFFPSNYSENKSTERVDRSGQIFKAPVSELETEPIRKEIDFEDSGPARSSESILA